MKARVKATGEIVNETAVVLALGDDFYLGELEPIPEDAEVVDYWTRLEHQYAGMAMQGMMAHTNIDFDEIVDLCVEFTHALIQKLKEKEERK